MNIKNYKLWSKDSKLDSFVEYFETKDDILLDQKLLEYDVKGSIAHAKMLNKIGLFTKDELNKLEKGLKEIIKLNEKGKFNLEFGDEDIHTKIENYLTERYGEVGKKIHTGRSRNDQVLTAIRLYSKDKLKNIEKELTLLIKGFILFAKKYGTIQMPGYTHMQKAMPSSIKIWGESFAEGLTDDSILLKTAQKINNQSPLGSVAGYGVSLPLDKNYTAKLLGFEKVQNNPLYCQNSKGKIEGLILSALIQILLTINKFASDIMLFTTSELNFFDVSSKLTSGSSIMPQKKNIDIAELLRSKVHLVLGNYTQIVSLSSNLISGYNRDLQDIKKPLFESLEITLDSLKVAKILLENMVPNKKKLEESMTSELYATEKALKLVQSGVSFREAYQNIKEKMTNS
ncbi:MAG: argininosuccinate lyase [bacterium]|nr:argininosuccinate lyase [bacterium]